MFGTRRRWVTDSVHILLVCLLRPSFCLFRTSLLAPLENNSSFETPLFLLKSPHLPQNPNASLALQSLFPLPLSFHVDLSLTLPISLYDLLLRLPQLNPFGHPFSHFPRFPNDFLLLPLFLLFFLCVALHPTPLDRSELLPPMLSPRPTRVTPVPLWEWPLVSDRLLMS